MLKLINEATRVAINEIIDHNSTVLTLKSDVAELKSDVAELKSDVAELKSDVSTLKQDVHHLTLMQEQMQTDIKLILDAVIPAQRRAEHINEIAASVDDHEIRILAVESSVRDHLRDKAKHGG